MCHNHGTWTMHKILAGTTEWKIYHRRREYRWNDNIKIPLQDIGCEDVNWFNFWENIRTGLFVYVCRWKDDIVLSEITASENGMISHYWTDVMRKGGHEVSIISQHFTGRADENHKISVKLVNIQAKLGSGTFSVQNRGVTAGDNLVGSWFSPCTWESI